MAVAMLGPVASGCRTRLVDHYGPVVEDWLVAVPGRLADAARRWGLRLVEYHDAGSASVLAVARTQRGHPVLLKAWYSRTRYVREVAGLRAWTGGPVPRLLRCADDLSVGMIELIGGCPGGCQPPERDEVVVAEALHDLHGASRDPMEFPTLEDYLAGTVLPRIGRRLRTVGVDLRDHYQAALAHLDRGVRSPVLLHADLYRENIVFDHSGRPVFIDPLPMLGDPAFDWAFWTVYYDLARDPLVRLELAARVSGISADVLASWCLLLCVDGLCYYREVDDPRQGRMAEVLSALAAAGCEAGS
jgi:streptomycin 6-kinase